VKCFADVLTDVECGRQLEDFVWPAATNSEPGHSS